MPPLSPQSLKCTGWQGLPRGLVRRMMIRLMKRIAHAISGIGEKPALLTECGLLLLLKVVMAASEERGGGD